MEPKKENYKKTPQISEEETSEITEHVGTYLLDDYNKMNLENKQSKRNPNYHNNNRKKNQQLLNEIEGTKSECKKLNLILEKRKINKKDIFNSAVFDFKETVVPYIYKNTLNYYQRINYLENKLQKLMKFLDKSENQIEIEFFEKIKKEKKNVFFFQEEFKKNLSSDFEKLKKKYFFEEEDLKKKIFELSNQNEKLIKTICEKEKDLKNKKTEFFENLKENEDNLNLAYKKKKEEKIKNLEKNFLKRIKNLENQIEIERNKIICINKEIGIEKDQTDILILKEFKDVIVEKNNKEKEIIEKNLNKNFELIKNNKKILDQKILNFEGKIEEKKKENERKKKLKEKNIEDFFQKEFKILSEKNKNLKINLKNLEEKNKNLDVKNQDQITKYFEDKKRNLDILIEKENYKNFENPQNYNLLNNNIKKKENDLYEIKNKIDFLLQNSKISEKKREMINQILNK